jgi:hypothetical protein
MTRPHDLLGPGAAGLPVQHAVRVWPPAGPRKPQLRLWLTLEEAQALMDQLCAVGRPTGPLSRVVTRLVLEMFRQREVEREREERRKKPPETV